LITPKRAQAINRPEIFLDQYAPVPLHRQLYERLRAAILTGQLEEGARLPSTRALASELGISRTTTMLAYECLLLEGFLESRVGDGTRVAHLQPGRPPKVLTGLEKTEKPTTSQANTRIDTTRLSKRTGALLRSPYPGLFSATGSGSQTGAFRVGQPDLDQMPYALWARLLARRARQSLRDVSGYQNAAGYRPLREALAAQVGITRGVVCSPDQVILTAGAQGAFDLSARVLLDPGDSVWIEDPGYLGAHGALLGAGAKLVAVPVDEEGIDVENGRQLSAGARLVSVTPSHQFPTGITMSLQRRLTLLDWARKAGAWILEDDYDSEFRFGGRPLEALQSLDTSRSVVYIGSFSKVLFPALRLGFLIVPSGMVDGFLAVRRFIDTHIPLLEQMALADFMVEGHFTRHLRRMRRLYSERRDALIDELQRTVGDWVEICVPDAGMHLVAWLPSGMDDQAAARRAAAAGLEVLPVSRFSLNPPPRGGLLLGYAAATGQELRDGVKKLAAALRAPTSL
jgi:GntR family transcriptional regulator/MocR family aminotransferase